MTGDCEPQWIATSAPSVCSSIEGVTAHVRRIENLIGGEPNWGESTIRRMSV